MKAVIDVERTDCADVCDPRQGREQRGRVEAAAERDRVAGTSARLIRQRRPEAIEKAALGVAFRLAARRQPSLYTP
jgi:hypothetical protein